MIKRIQGVTNKIKIWHNRRRLQKAISIYRESEHWQKDTLDAIHLQPPLFYKPTADGKNLVKWNVMCQGNKADFPKDLKSALDRTIVTETLFVSDFDFSTLQSLTDSKGFGQNFISIINGSWFPDLASWGRGMYPGKDLSGLDDKDWENNKQHIEREAFSLERPVPVIYYSWINRHEGQQDGGSHHTAMLIHQMLDQKRTYTRKAKVTKYSLDLSLLNALNEHYAMFVGNSDAHSSKLPVSSQNLYTVLLHFVAKSVHILPISGSNHKASAYFVPYTALLIDKNIFETWYKNQVARGRLLPLLNVMTNTLDYCTTPYLHELDEICLGDPMRECDIYTKTHREILF